MRDDIGEPFGNKRFKIGHNNQYDMGQNINYHNYVLLQYYQMDSIFNSDFHKGVIQTHNEVKTWSLSKILFPDTKYISDGDQFFREIWKAIDSSKNYAWITTYAMDKSIPGNTTLSKLIEARRRGVNTVLFVDDLQQWLDPQLLQQYKTLGGVFYSLNPQWRLSSLRAFANQQIFRRHHEKILVSDNVGIIGSSNLESAYGGSKYGSSIFMDLNFYSENINLKEYREHIQRIANMYNVQLNNEKTNDSVMNEYNEKYPNTNFVKEGEYKFIYSHQPHIQQIQQEVLKQISESKKNILVVQPYYYPIKKFETEISKALERGVKVELITSAKRDQPVYKYIKNGLLLRRLIKKGLVVHQLHQKLLHTKAYVIDEKIVNIGSFNNDRWSWKINNQANINISSEVEYQKVKPYFDNLRSRCRIVQPNPVLGMMRKFKMKFWQKFLYLSECVMSKSKTFRLDSFWNNSPMTDDSNSK